MLDSVTAATFRPHLGEVFEMAVDPSTVIGATLMDVQEAGWAFSPADRRTPFSLYFRTDGPLVLPQRTYRLHHPVLGELEIFLVPSARTADGVLYEAVFN